MSFNYKVMEKVVLRQKKEPQLPVTPFKTKLTTQIIS